MKKRILSFFIIACMVLTMFPTSVFAVDINALLMDNAASKSNVEDKIEKEGSEPLLDSGTSTPPASSSVPDSGTSAPAVSSSVPNSGTSTPPDSVSAPNNSTSLPDSSTSVPNSDSTTPPDSVSAPNSSTSVPDSGTSVPPESISAPSSSVPKIDGEEKAEDEELQANLPSMMSGVLAEGTYGGCDWVIGEDYTLTISPTPSPADGLTSGVLFSPNGETSHNVPWSAYRAQILKVEIKDGVKSGANLNSFLNGLQACTTMDLSGLDTTAAIEMGYMFNGCNSLQELDISGFNTAKVTNMVGMFAFCLALETLNVGDDFDTSAVTNMGSMFHNCPSLENLNLGDKFDTSAVFNMHGMFQGCTALKELDLSNFNLEKAMDMDYMFKDCVSLKELDFSKLNTGRVNNMSYMFSGCTSLEKLDLSNFNTENVSFMSNMFSGCIALKELDLSKFNTGRVNNMSNMFSGCTALEKLDLSGFNTEMVTNMYAMFASCVKLENLNLGNNFDTAAVTNMTSMFYNCVALKTLALGKKFDTAAVTKMSAMFASCENLENLNLGNNFDTAVVTNMTSMFSGCKELQKLDLSGFNTAQVTGMYAMFNSCEKLENLILGNNFDTAAITNMASMFSNCAALKTLALGEKFATTNVKAMYGMFKGCKELQNLDLSGFNTANVKDMSWMFGDCIKLDNLNLGENFDTAAVTDMSNMFYYCASLKTLTLGEKFTTTNVVDMSGMFSGCKELQKLDLSGFNTAQVTDMSFMFSVCKELQKLDLSGFNTANVQNMSNMFTGSIKLDNLNLGDNFNTAAVTNMSLMFYNCASLKTLALGKNFTATNVQIMNGMFYDCKELQKLDLSKFNTENVIYMVDVFRGCTALEKLDLSGFNTAKVTDMSNMFSGCKALKALDISGLTIGGSTDITDMLKDNTLILKTDYYKTAMNSGSSVITLYDKASKDDLTTTDLDGTETNIKYMPQVITASLNDITLTGAMSDTDAKAFFDTAKVFNNGTSQYIEGNGYAYPGAKITVDAKDENKLLDSFAVVKTGDETTKITVTDNAFTMPAYPVTIKYTAKVNIIWDNQDATTSQIGGRTVLNLDDAIVIPNTAPVKTGYAFGGWFTEANGKGTQITATSKAPAVSKITYYAKWTALKYTITGTVTKENKKPLAGATLNLIKNGQTVMSTKTNTNGEFKLVNVPYGEGYTIKASKAMYIMQKSEKFALTDTVNLDYEASFKLKELEKIISGVGENNPFDLSDLANALKPDEAGVTKIELKVSSTPEISKEIKAELESLGKPNSKTKYFDLSILKYINNASVAIDETNGLVKIVMPIDVDIQGNGAYELLRKHGNNSAKKITTTKNANGEYIEISPTFIAAYLKFFSVYAIQYTEEQAVTPPNPEKDYLLTLADTGDNSYGGGKMNIGDTVKIYAGTKQGYRFIGWETTNGGILADTTSAETTFKMVNGPCTLIARWVAIEGHSGKKNPATGVGTEVPSNAMALALPLALASIGGTLLIARKRKHN